VEQSQLMYRDQDQEGPDLPWYRPLQTECTHPWNEKSREGAHSATTRPWSKLGGINLLCGPIIIKVGM
jgi:hypothetical protein